MSDTISTEDLGKSLLLAADAVAAANTERDDDDESTTDVDKPVSSATSTHPCDIMMIEGGIIKVAKSGGACSDPGLNYEPLVITPLRLVEQYLRSVGSILIDPKQTTIVKGIRDELENQG